MSIMCGLACSGTWVLGNSNLIQVLGKYMIIGYLDLKPYIPLYTPFKGT